MGVQQPVMSAKSARNMPQIVQRQQSLHARGSSNNKFEVAIINSFCFLISIQICCSAEKVV